METQCITRADGPIPSESELGDLRFGFVEPMTLGAAHGQEPDGECCNDQRAAAFDEEEVLPAAEMTVLLLDLKDPEGDEAREGAGNSHGAVEDGETEGKLVSFIELRQVEDCPG